MEQKPLWKREPAQLVGLLYGLIAGFATFLVTIQAQISDDSNWKEVALIALATGIPLLQGKNTREVVYSPATYERDVFGMSTDADKPVS